MLVLELSLALAGPSLAPHTSHLVKLSLLNIYDFDIPSCKYVHSHRIDRADGSPYFFNRRKKLFYPLLVGLQSYPESQIDLCPGLTQCADIKKFPFKNNN